MQLPSMPPHSSDVAAVVARACERVPGLTRGALVLLPDGLLLAGVGSDSALELEPLIRSAGRCFTGRTRPPLANWRDEPFVEYLSVVGGQLVVIEGGRRDPRLALALACTREHNVGLALRAARLAMTEVEAEVDLSALGCA
jgi:hypothetical protein